MSNLEANLKMKSSKETRKSFVEDVAQLQEEYDTVEAQRDHYRQRCEELEQELNEMRVRLTNKVKMSDLDVNNPSIFYGESLERLRGWQKCIAFCIEESEAEERMESLSTCVSGKGALGQETLLPFSPLGLSGNLTRNHRLTQKYTEYPEPKAKEERTIASGSTAPIEGVTRN